jgi:choline dehydrogenase-like flavoprotein
LNSFPQVKNAGSRFSAHFISAIFARVPRMDYNFHGTLHKRPANEGLELAAIYLAGVNKRTGGQFHVQLTAVSDTNPNDPAHLQTAARNMPDVVATASQEQLRDSRDHILFVCAVLGELDYSNDRNWFRKNDGGDPTTDVTLQVLENTPDRLVWDTMDESTFQTLEQVFSPKGQAHVEYWHGSPEKGEWKRSRPPVEQIRVPGLVHESSTLWIGAAGDEDAVVGLDYRLKGVKNVHVTGGSLWPTGGSWNPTLTMVALAQDLADQLLEKAKIAKGQRVG